MAIVFHCPDCSAKIQVPEGSEGRKARCPRCEGVVTLTPDLRAKPNPPPTARPAPPEAIRVSPGRSHDTNTSADDFDVGPPQRDRDEPRRRSRDDDDYDRDEPRRRRREESGGSLTWLWVTLGVLLLLGGGGAIIWFVVLADEGEMTTAKAIDYLNSGSKSKRLKAARWLATAQVEPDKLDEVMAAIGMAAAKTMMEGDPQTALEIGMATQSIAKQQVQRRLDAMGGGPNPFGGGPNPFGGGGDPAKPETPDTMLEKLRNRAGHSPDRHQAMRKLTELKDARAPGPIASYLPEFFDRGPATEALRQFGPGAEQAVLPYLNHPDQSTANAARDLLKGYGTRAETLIDQSIRDLQAPEAGRKRQAATWLSQAARVDGKAAAVATALEGLLADQDQGVRDQGMKALGVWGSADNVPAIVDLLNEGNKPNTFLADYHRLGFEALARLKDPRGAVAIAAYLPNFFCGDTAAISLRQMGAVAEKEVVKFVHHPDGGARTRARDLLKGYKTKDAIVAAQSAEDLKADDVNRRMLAADWLATTTKPDDAIRDDVARALVERVSDPHHDTARHAVRALDVWGTKDSVEPLVKVLEDEDPRFNHLRVELIKTLGTLGDERAALAIARRLRDFFARRDAALALKKMKGAAEKVVILALAEPDAGVRREACMILEEIGTMQSVKPLQLRIRSDPDGGVKAAAQRALQVILTQPPKP